MSAVAHVWAEPNARYVERLGWTAVLEAQLELGFISDSDQAKTALATYRNVLAHSHNRLDASHYPHGVMRRREEFELDSGDRPDKTHIGLASSDIVDLRVAVQTAQSAELLSKQLLALFDRFYTFFGQESLRRGVLAARTHGEEAHAVPAMRRVAPALMPLVRGLCWLSNERLAEWRGIGGATGGMRDLAVMYRMSNGLGDSVTDSDRLQVALHRLNAAVAGRLGLSLISGRDDAHAGALMPQDGCHTVDREQAYLFAQLGGLLRSFCDQVRLWHAIGFASTSPPLVSCQTGTSSSMLHKRSGWEWERLRSVALTMQGEAAMLADALYPASWLEGDVSSHAVRHRCLPILWMAAEEAVDQLAYLLPRTQLKPPGDVDEFGLVSADEFTSAAAACLAAEDGSGWAHAREYLQGPERRLSKEMIDAVQDQLAYDCNRCFRSVFEARRALHQNLQQDRLAYQRMGLPDVHRAAS